MHPANQFLNTPKTNLSEEVAVYRQAVDTLLERRIFGRPSE